MTEAPHEMQKKTVDVNRLLFDLWIIQ